MPPLLIALLLSTAPVTDPAFESIVSGLASRSHAESCAQMEAWLSANPSSPEVPRGRLWLARVWLLDGREDLARPLMERARKEGAGTRWESAAAKELADLDLAEHRFSAAIAGYDRLATSSDPYWKTLGTLALQSARTARARWISLWAVGLALLALVAARFAFALHSGAKLRPVPAEVYVGAPVALALVVLGLGRPPAQQHAVMAIALGGLVLAWTNAIVLRGNGLSPKRRVGEVALAAGQALALSYCALVGSGLWGKLMATLRLGGGG